MSIDKLRDQIPDYAKDIRLNLGTLASETTLSDQQKWGAFLATAFATGSLPVISSMQEEIKGKLSPEAITATRSAAAIMAMNNIYYRSTHLMTSAEYQKMPAKLRMNIIANPGIDKVDFELWSLGVSAINGCGMCLDAHERVVRKAGVSAEQVQTVLRIAAVINASAAVLRAEYL